MSVYVQIDDLHGLAASCRRGRALGFIGRAAIHPRQLPVIAECFMPTEAEASAARELLDALADANGTEHGVVVLPSGQFVDRAMIKGAERVIALAARRRSTTH
jgi:citrate lyase subunit beta/citryl-CoA lyase